MLRFALVALWMFGMVDTRADTVEASSDRVDTTSAAGDIVSTADTTDGPTEVYLYRIHDDEVGMIGPSAWRITEKALDAAEERGVDLILLDLDTYGGYVDAADKIKTRILNTEIPVFVFIRNNAASAGALISIACDSIYMAPGATIGAASVVDGEGNVLPEKYQSYMRGEMRVTAEANGRDPLIAEGMVDERVVVPGIVDSTRIITFTADEAIANGYCEGKATSVDDALELAGIADYVLVEHTVSGVETVINFFINPAVAGILLLIIVGGIYFELQTPGVGFPLAAAAAAAVLYFIPHYLEGLADHWEVVLFIAGIILIALELFVIPGFGVAGVLGILASIAGLTLSLVGNVDLDFTFVPDGKLMGSFLLVVGVFSLLLILFIVVGSALSTSPMFKRVALQVDQDRGDGYVISSAASLQTVVGRSDTATTHLRPSGKVEVDGDLYDAQSDGEFIEPGTSIRVDGVRGAYLVVSSDLS